MTPLTLAELRARHAELNLRAERKREEWMATPSVGTRALTLGKQVKSLDKRAAEYADLLRVAEAMT